MMKTKLKKKIPQEKDIFKHIEIVSTESQRLHEIIMKYLKYLKLNDKQRQKTDLRKILEGK